MTSFISRFRKPKSDEESVDGADAMLSEGEDEGLLMATSLQSERPANKTRSEEPSLSAEAPSSPESALDAEAGMLDELDLAAQEDKPLPEEPSDPLDSAQTMTLEPAGDLQNVESGASAEEQADPLAAGGADDAFSLFRDAVAESENTDLTRDLEDIPISEILADLREIRQLLGIEGEPAAEEDG